VGDVWVLPAGAEVPDEQAHRVARLGEPLGRPPAAVRGGEQRVVGRRRVGVGDDDPRGDRLAAGEPDADGAPVLDQDLGDGGFAADLAALIFDQPDQAGDEAVGAAHREVNAVGALEEADQRVHRGDRQRIAADEQRMEREDDPQPRIPDVAADQLEDAAVAAQPDEVRQDARHVDPRGERRVAELFEADPVDRLALLS